MEFRQLRSFVRTVELGSMGRAALELGLATSALSQQISKLESEISTVLLQRSPNGVVPTDAGLVFFQHAQLLLRHASEAAHAAQHSRISGQVTVGMAPTTATVLGLPFLLAMKERYPDVRLHIVESLSHQLSLMLDARQLDLAIVFDPQPGHRRETHALFDERFYVIGARDLAGMPARKNIALTELGDLPLILPGTLGLRKLIDSTFSRARLKPTVVAEIDGIAMQMEAVKARVGATIHPGSATVRVTDPELSICHLSDTGIMRTNFLASLPESEMSPVGLGTRVLLDKTIRSLIRGGKWPGAILQER